MKTCVLLSGLPRHVERGYRPIYDALIEPNNADIFIHTWIDQNVDKNFAQQIQNMYKPVRMIAEPQKKFINSSMVLDRMMASHGRSYERDKFVEMLYSSWYSTQKANLIKEEYRLENNFTYDYVIRARFDITYTMKIFCEKYDPNIVHISNRGLPEEMIDDRFAFASNSLMNVYCSGFNYLNFVHEMRERKDGIMCGETLLYEIFRMNGINHKKIEELAANHLR